MRIWIILSAIVILLFCIPGLLWTLFVPDWKEICIYLVLNALAIHALYYCKVATTEPVSGYRHLAVNQLLLGFVCGALLVRLGFLLADPALWEQAYQQVVAIMQQMPNLQATPQQIEQALDEVFTPWRRTLTLVPLWVALLTVLSQAFFAWLLYRRAKPADHAARP